ncbi:MAG: XdhC family protein, partial [Chloroflexota bacterium]|nr:XdhC family protein [Chloroflexota bacterium]
VWVEPLKKDALLDTLRDRLLANEGVSLLTVVEGPRVGNRTLVSSSCTAVSTPGVDPGLSDLAAVVCGEAVVELRALSDSRVFVQFYPPPRRLIIIGAVHIAAPLVTLASTLGYFVTVVDARSAFATRERFPDVDELVIAWPDDALAKLRPDSSTAVVVLAHDAKFDEPAIAGALNSDAGYIGAIGSRATAAGRVRQLQAQGYCSDQVSRVHSPIGLELGSVTPEEIALSILAEIVATLQGSPQRAVREQAGGVR